MAIRSQAFPSGSVGVRSADLGRATGNRAECHRTGASAVMHEFEMSRHSVAGVGLLLILDRMVEPRSVESARRVVPPQPSA
jgi:hypothetical protein